MVAAADNAVTAAPPKAWTRGAPPAKAVEQLRLCVRLLNQRSTHSWWLPEGPWTAEYIAHVLREHLFTVEAGPTPGSLRVTHVRGRVYELDQARRKDRWQWRYRTVVDPIGGIEQIDREQRADEDLFYVLKEQTTTPDEWWWDGHTPLAGRFVAFDLETTPVTDGQLPAIVLGAVANERGEFYLLTPEQIIPWFLLQLRHFPEQILCNWNLAGFDLPVMVYRLAGFRERVFDVLIDRLYRGYVYDTMLMTQLRDVALYGTLFNPKTAAQCAWHRGWGKQVYALGPQAKRFLGVKLKKGETLMFWRYLDNPKAIPRELASYAFEDVIATAAIQAELHSDPFVLEVADKARDEMDVISGIRLQRPDDLPYDELLERANCHFGWQTHTIQFAGSFSLAWVTVHGIAVDIDHVFSIIHDLEKQQIRKLTWLAGRPGRVIWRIHKDERTQVSWIADYEKIDAELERLRQAVLEDDENADPVFEVGPVEQFTVRVVKRDERGYVERDAQHKPLSRTFQFVRQRSLNEKAIREYLQESLPTLRGKLAKGQKLNPRELDRIGLQQKQWMVKFGAKDIASIPDPVLRAKFEIAGFKKRIATVKTYLPGFATHPERDRLKSLHSDDLRKRLRLEGVSVGRVFPRFRPLLATGRTGAFDPNLQQVERSNRMRGCFIADAGCLLIINDYGAAEMVTQGEIYCHRYPEIPWENRLARYLNDGYDPHILTGMKTRFPFEEHVWGPIIGDPDIRRIKRAMEPEELRAAILKIKTRRSPTGAEVPEFAKLDENTRVAGEDVAKSLWVSLAAQALARHEFASKGLSPSADELTKRTDELKKVISSGRQAAKPINFGIPGGMRPPRIVTYAWTDYKVAMSLKEATEGFDRWMQTYPEGLSWLRDGSQPPYKIDDPPFPFAPHYDRCFVITGRLRGHLVQGGTDEADEADDADDDESDDYKGARRDDEPEHDPGHNEWHNTQFQGLAADAAKLGLWYCWRQGITTGNYVHDELDAEGPEAVAWEWQGIIKQGMRQGMDDVTEFLNVTVGSATMSRLKKG